MRFLLDAMLPRRLARRLTAGNTGNEELERRVFAELAAIEDCLMKPGFVELTRRGLVVHEP